MQVEQDTPGGTTLEQGLWRVLVRWLRVPEEPPELPGSSHRQVDVFLPAPDYLRYLRCEAVLTAILIALVLAAAGLVMLLTGKVEIGWIMIGAAPVVLVIGGMLALLARLRFRTMWYALTDRSLRARHGLWTIHEVTITFENVQNISVAQGPLMRLFGIWKLDIQTAGGSRKAARSDNPMLSGLLIAIQIVVNLLPGGAAFAGAGATSGKSKRGAAATGTIHGLLDPLPVRNRIMEKVKRSRSAGFGDEWSQDERTAARAKQAVTREHVRALRSIRDRLVAEAEL